MSIFLDKELLDHIETLFLVFWGTSLLFSIVAAPVYIPNTVQEFLFLHTFLQHLFVHFFMIVILTSVRQCLILVLVCISLTISDAEYVFTCLLAICMSSLEKCVFRSSPYILIGFFVLLRCSCMRCLLIWILTLCWWHNLQIFSFIL